jgi:acyl transferase domain-containing protein
MVNDSTIEHAIAIIGMSARFPGGFDSKTIWPVLEAGNTTATRFSHDELDPSLSRDLVNSSNYVPVRGVLAEAEFFDADYFGFSSREAEILDPQQRVFLQLAVHALEDAGYYRDTREYPIGVYAGLSNITYFRNHLAHRPDVLARIGELNAMMGNEKDYLATRVAHKLDLTGPCLNISTACSTSSVAIAQAFYALQTYQCDLALAGGISVTTPQNRGYIYQEGSILSPDGVCRSFDARAQGTFFSNGGGIIVMKRLQEAIEDEDCIAAIIRGVGVNNDGAKRASFAAPGVEGQAEAIAQALAHAEVDARDIGLVEAHGTATPIGDPIEIEALKMAYQEHTSDRGYCAIGSIKSNLGHLDVAAGIAGVIKAVMSLQARKIPPIANFQSPNPELRIEETPFYINDRCIDWPEGKGPRLAGVSSFGSGGTNAHLILQEAPLHEARVGREPPLNVVMLSAKSEAALTRQIEQFRRFSAENTNLPLSNIAHTLRVGRRDEECREAVVAESTKSLSLALDGVADKSVFAHAGAAVKNIAFVFPGQGSQYPGMGKSLYDHSDCFRMAMDSCFSIFDRHLDRSLKNVLFGEPDRDDPAINQTAYAQPALFTIGYALSKLYGNAGINPDVMVGHSIGEYLAAYFAGVFSLEDVIAVVATRGRLMQSMAPGAMLAILAGPDEFESKLSPEVQIAAYNSHRSTVVAGSLESIEAVQAELEASKIMVKRVRTSHAFHTPMMEKAADQLSAFLDDIPRNPPEIPFVSTVTGNWISEDEVATSKYWGDQIRKPVRFSQAATFLMQQGQYTLLEMGPGTTATGFLRQHITDKSIHAAFPALDTRNGKVSESEAYMNTLARLWEQGHDLMWKNILNGDSGQRISLPGYPFEAKRHWIEATTAEPVAQVPTESATPESPSDIVPAEQADRSDEGSSQLNDLGFDSLLLTQLSIALKREYSTDVPFRRLLEDLGTFSVLHDYIEETMPENVRSRFLSPGISDESADTQPVDPTDYSKKKEPETNKSRGASITRSQTDSISTNQ